MLLLDRINLTKQDIVYLTWDLVIRGPNDIKVLNFLIKNKKQFFPVLWNQEYFILKYLENKNNLINLLLVHKEKELQHKKINEEKDKIKYIKKLHVYKEVRELAKKIKDNKSIIKYIKNLPNYIEKNDFILVHAGFIDWIIEGNSNEELTWISRNLKYNWYENYHWSKKVIYWHHCPQWIRISRNNTIWIDSACVNGWFLTAYILETGEIIQQKSLKIYKELKYDPNKIKK